MCMYVYIVCMCMYVCVFVCVCVCWLYSEEYGYCMKPSSTFWMITSWAVHIRLVVADAHMPPVEHIVLVGQVVVSLQQLCKKSIHWIIHTVHIGCLHCIQWDYIMKLMKHRIENKAIVVCVCVCLPLLWLWWVMVVLSSFPLLFASTETVGEHGKEDESTGTNESDGENCQRLYLIQTRLI